MDRKPDETILTRSAVIAMLQMSEDTFDRMVKEGRFPRGIKTSAGLAPIWTLGDVLHWLAIAGRMIADEEKEKK